ncbi:caspase-3-like [Hyperolius riggenbachi]|uniref:caspase-3-like n=1 Tax=Hyperolius riggenbachi TaxID=752182 RepID=UPI0035A3661F
MSEPDAIPFQEDAPSSDPSRNDKSHQSNPSQGEMECKYDMDLPKKGKCLIINMENFSYKDKKQQVLPKRPGTDQDALSLRKVFELIGFEVQIEKDPAYKEYDEIMKNAAKEDHSKNRCFVCVILSHGDLDGFYIKDDHIKWDSLFQDFKPDKCPSLVGKPKLFFAQACRGNKRDSGVTCHSSGEDKPIVNRIPEEADILCHYSTPPGYVAWRDKEEGSWFIQTLCEMLEKHWKSYELLQILTCVNNKVAYQYETSTGKKEMPCIVSTLTKCLYLK